MNSSEKKSYINTKNKWMAKWTDRSIDRPIHENEQINNLYVKIPCMVNVVFRVIDVVRKEKTKQRPQALNTVEMLRVASSGLGKKCTSYIIIAHNS